MRETVGQRGTVALAGSSSRSYIQPMQRRGFTQLRPTERRPSAARVREHALRIGREHLQRPQLRDRAALGLRAGELPHQHAHRYLTRGQKGASTSRRRRHNRPVSGLGGNVQTKRAMCARHAPTAPTPTHLHAGGACGLVAPIHSTLKHNKQRKCSCFCFSP